MSGTRESTAGLSMCGLCMGVSNPMNNNPDIGYMFSMSINFPFHRYTCLVSKLTKNPSSHNFPTDMKQRYFVDGRICIRR